MTITTRMLRGCGAIMSALICVAAIAPVQAADPTKKEATASPWSVEASAGLEYDDNITVPEIDVSSGQSDMAAVFDLSVGYKVPGLSDYEVEGGYDFYQSLYQDYSEFNLQNHSLHVSGSREFNDLDVGLAYRFTYALLDGHDFLRIHHLQPNLGYSVRPNWYLTFAYSYQDKKFFDFSPRDGQQHALLLDNYIVFNGNKSYVRFGYRYEDENTDGPAFDYTGHYLNLGLSTPWKLSSQHGTLELGYQYYTRDYSNITPIIGKKRDDDRSTFNVKGTLDLPSNFFASLNYQYINANSNLPSADFDENIVTLSAGRRW